MVSYYDSTNLRANAFMISEVGHGFLCSVGFPFQCDGSKEANADSLANGFMMIFEKTKEKLLSGQDLHCAIGVSKGKIEGYFPKFGPAKYNLHGDSIIKAVRYESMATVVFEQLQAKNDNIIILDETVFNQLDAEEQSSYHRFQLDENGVRDDPKAVCLYYKIG